MERVLQTLRRVRNGFAHSTTTASLADPGYADRLNQAYAAARVNSLWQPLERILQEKVGGDGISLDPALRDYILLITILVAFLESAAQQLFLQPPAVVMGFAGIHAPLAQPAAELNCARPAMFPSRPTQTLTGFSLSARFPVPTSSLCVRCRWR